MNTVAELNVALAGRYLIEQQIGQGGMATVYRARDLRHDRSVAIKVFNPEVGVVLGAERFFAEITMTAKLQHPHLLPLFDSGNVGGLLFYVMPCIEGESLRSRLDRERQLPIDESLRLMVAVLGALEHAHRRGVIHRDIKPENILLHEGQPLLADFGIALALSSTASTRLTGTGLSIGTPQYASPEQVTGDRQIDCRADIYSMGAVLFEMLTGDPPHSASTLQAMIARVLTDRPRDVRVSRPSIPEHVAAALECALEKLPADRFASAQHFASALGATPGTGMERRRDTPRPATLTRQGVRQRVRDPLLLGMLAVIAAFAGIIGWHWATDRPQVPDVAVRFALDVSPEETVATGEIGSPFALSADGSALAYMVRPIGTATRLFLRRIGTGGATEIPGTAGAIQPAFSPDGRWLSFVVDGKVEKVVLGGGAPVVLARLPAPYGLAWTHDGRIVAGQSNGAMVFIPTAGGDAAPFATLDTAHHEISQRWPTLLPDGETVLYTSWRGTVASARIGVASLRTGASQVLDLPGTFPLGVTEGHLVFADTAGRLMAVPFNAAKRRVTGAPVRKEQGVVSIAGAAKAALSASGTLVYQTTQTGALEMVVVDNNGRVRTLPHHREMFSDPRVSPDGSEVAVTIFSDSTADVWLFGLATGTRVPLTSGGGSNSRPEWVADGSRVLYQSQRGGGVELWWQPRAGTPTRAVTRDANAAQGVPVGDGSVVLYRTDSESEDGTNIWMRTLGHDTVPHRVYARAGSTQSAPSLSPDRQWVTFTSNQTGKFEVYATAVSGAGPLCSISTDGGTEPAWSRDGKKIYYRNGTAMIEAPVVSLAHCGIGAPRTLFVERLYTDEYHRQYDPLPDGSGFVMLRRYDNVSGVEVVHNWSAELRRNVEP